MLEKRCLEAIAEKFFQDNYLKITCYNAHFRVIVSARLA